MQFLKHQFVACIVSLVLVMSGASLASAQNFIQPRDTTNYVSPSQAKELENTRNAIRASGDQYAAGRALQDLPMPLRYPTAQPKKSSQKSTTSATTPVVRPSVSSKPAIVVPFSATTPLRSAAVPTAASGVTVQEVAGSLWSGYQIYLIAGAIVLCSLLLGSACLVIYAKRQKILESRISPDSVLH